jgi:hypothetical protein
MKVNLACLRWTVCSCVGIAAGCSSFQTACFNKGEGVGADAVLMVPFSDPGNTRWYGESENGDMVAEVFKSWVRKNATPNFPEGIEVEKALMVIRDWKKERITSADLKGIASGLGAKYVVLGEIEKLSLTSPGKVGVLDPVITFSYRVVDVEGAQARIVWERKDFTLALATPRETEIPFLEIGADTEAIETKLLVKAGQQVAKDLYGYYPEEH